MPWINVRLRVRREKYNILAAAIKRHPNELGSLDVPSAHWVCAVMLLLGHSVRREGGG
jgi:hypothetical protein